MAPRTMTPPVIALALGFVLGAFGTASAGVVRPFASPLVRQGALYIQYTTTTASWTQLGYNSGHSGANNLENTIGTANVANLKQAWTFPAGSGNAVGNVVESAGIVYVPTANGTLYALNASTGDLVWSFSSGTGYTTSGSAPSVQNANIYTVCNTSANTQGVCALNAATGVAEWSYTFPGSDSFAGTPPIVSGGKVFFEGCATSCSYVALNEKGAVSWTVAEPQGSCEGNGGVTPAVEYSLMYVEETCPGANGTLVALDVSNGTTTWSAPEQPNVGLAVSSNLLAIDYQSVKYQLEQDQDVYNPKTGALLWTAPAWDGTIANYPDVSPQHYTFSWSEGDVAANGGKHGQLGWNSYPNDSNLSSPSWANGVIYAACPGTPCAYDATSGVLLWSGNPSGALTYGIPIIVNGAVYAACNATSVCAWAEPGSLRRRR